MIHFTVGIGQENERPLVMLLIDHQTLRAGEGNYYDRDSLIFELLLGGLHLSEVLLARQSCEMSEKDQKG